MYHHRQSGFVALRCTLVPRTPAPHALLIRITHNGDGALGLHLRGHTRVTHTTQCLWAGGTNDNCQSVIYQGPLCVPRGSRSFGRSVAATYIVYIVGCGGSGGKSEELAQFQCSALASSAFMSWFCIMPCKYRALSLSYCVLRMAGTQLMKYGRDCFPSVAWHFLLFILPGNGYRTWGGLEKQYWHIFPWTFRALI